jgi:prephenate dehydrogenase
MLSLGIIGQGSFGKFAAEKLDQHFVIKAYDTYAVVSAETSASLEDVCQCDYLMLAIPLSSYVELLPSIKSKLAPQTIVIDVSSVKVEPLRLLREYLVPEQLYVAMHPLFGPQSAAKTLEGFPVVFCESNLSPEKLQKMKNFCTELGLKVAEMTADEHDQQMAVVHALTFFVARSLNEFGVDEM